MPASKAEAHLAKYDPVMSQLVAQHGPCRIEQRGNLYNALVTSIIGQQLSVKSASAIRSRFESLYGDDLPTPQQILDIDTEKLREIGFSRAKAAYIKSLAEHILSGDLELDKLPQQDNDTIIRELTAVKGIGEWTAHMFLIFALGRLDVLPVGDLGVRMAVGRLYGDGSPSTPAAVVAVAESNRWQPYASVATWYLWRSLNNLPDSSPGDPAPAGTIDA